MGVSSTKSISLLLLLSGSVLGVVSGGGLVDMLAMALLGLIGIQVFSIAATITC